MNIALVVGWVGAVLAGCLVVAGVMFTMTRDIDTVAMIATMKRLLASGQADRARKLATAAPGSVLDAVSAGIEAGMAAPGRELSVVQRATSAAFDQVAARQLRLRKARVEMTSIGMLASVGALAQAAPVLGDALALVLVHGLVLAAGAWVALRRHRLATDVARTRTELMPTIVAVIARSSP